MWSGTGRRGESFPGLRGGLSSCFLTFKSCKGKDDYVQVRKRKHNTLGAIPRAPSNLPITTETKYNPHLSKPFSSPNEDTGTTRTGYDATLGPASSSYHKSSCHYVASPRNTSFNQFVDKIKHQLPQCAHLGP